VVTVYIHLEGLESVLGELEEMPTPSDVTITCYNSRRRDGKEINFILREVTKVIFPMHVIKFIEIMPTDEGEEIETFIRE
jgi:hypothetical protein